MGIDYDGSMIVGAKVTDMDLSFLGDVDLYDWMEEHDMRNMSPYFDAPPEHWTIGFTVCNIDISAIDEWIPTVKEMAATFTELTGHPAKLIGMQNIW